MASSTSSAATPPAARDREARRHVPPISTAGPATAVPSAAPTPKVVTSQENASVTVPRGRVPVDDHEGAGERGRQEDSGDGGQRRSSRPRPGVSVSGR